MWIGSEHVAVLPPLLIRDRAAPLHTRTPSQAASPTTGCPSGSRQRLPIIPRRSHSGQADVAALLGLGRRHTSRSSPAGARLVRSAESTSTAARGGRQGRPRVRARRGCEPGRRGAAPSRRAPRPVPHARRPLHALRVRGKFRQGFERGLRRTWGSGLVPAAFAGRAPRGALGGCTTTTTWLDCAASRRSSSGLAAAQRIFPSGTVDARWLLELRSSVHED